MWCVWNTLYPEQVKSTLNHARSQRYSVENEDVQNEKIEIDQDWKEELQNWARQAEEKMANAPSSSSCATARCPKSAAQCSGVQPSVVFVSLSAPRSSSSAATVNLLHGRKRKKNV